MWEKLTALFGTLLEASFVGNLIQYFIAKRTTVLDRQRSLIRKARKLITSTKEEIGEKFLKSVIYAELKPHLSAEVIKAIEAPRTIYVPPGNGTFVKNTMVLDDISRLEKLWKL